MVGGGCHGTTIGKKALQYFVSNSTHFCISVLLFEKNMTMKQKLENHGFDLRIHFIFASKLHHCQIGWYIAVQWFWAVKGLTPCTAHTSMHVLTSDKCAALIFMRSLVPNVCKRLEFEKFFSMLHLSISLFLLLSTHRLFERFTV